MKRTLALLTGAAVLATPAIAQVRPENCQPVFPVVDKVASVLPQDVMAEPAAPAAVAKRRFLGLPLLLPALAGLGGVAALVGGDDDGGSQNVSPA
jgi:hypothetical protein